MPRSNDTLTQLPDFAEPRPKSQPPLPQKAKTIQLLTEGHQLRKVMQEADERLKEIKSELTQIQLLNDLPGLRYNNYCFIAVERAGRQTLSKEKLIDYGVDPRIIADSMVTGGSYMQCELQVIGEKEERQLLERSR